MKVLIVEDNASVARLLNQAACEAGYAPQICGDGQAALECAFNESFDLILLDVMLPKLDGLEVMRRLREQKIETPVLMITARDALEDKVAGLDAGADDYIVKPFQVAELLARMRALLRRGGGGLPLLRVGDLELDPATRRAKRNGKTILLSATEYSLLEYLMRHPGRTLTRAQILDHVWQYDFGGQDNVLDVYISYLRQKIDKGHRTKLIHTARGVGFCLGEEH
jgi:DNA-binding response OmpR family regulator